MTDVYVNGKLATRIDITVDEGSTPPPDPDPGPDPGPDPTPPPGGVIDLSVPARENVEYNAYAAGDRDRQMQAPRTDTAIGQLSWEKKEGGNPTMQLLNAAGQIVLTQLLTTTLTWDWTTDPNYTPDNPYLMTPGEIYTLRIIYTDPSSGRVDEQRRVQRQ